MPAYLRAGGKEARGSVTDPRALVLETVAKRLAALEETKPKEVK